LVGADDYERRAIDQVLDYAVDLKNFHEGSHNRTLVPILVATKAVPRQLGVQTWADGVMRPILTNRETFLPTIREVLASLNSIPIEAEAWAASSYKPTPTIVEAAQALYRGHDVQEISRSEPGAENLSRTGAYIAKVIEEAKRIGRKAICFETAIVMPDRVNARATGGHQSRPISVVPKFILELIRGFYFELSAAAIRSETSSAMGRNAFPARWTSAHSVDG
jgi:hypothetical protein